jgi:hypothetical protein
MQRSAIRDSVSPGFAALHPGYGSLAHTSKPVAKLLGSSASRNQMLLLAFRKGL